MSKYLYLLDNGHGVETKKKSSPRWKDGTQLHEYEFNRNVVKYLSFMLKDAKIDYEILVPELNDIPIRHVRAVRANEHPRIKYSILISIHANKYPPNEKVNGFETHYFKRNDYESERGKEIALVFQKYLGTLGNDRGTKGSPFAILRWPKCPAILTENGFYSNETECRRLMTTDFQYKIAEQHFNAIKELEES